MALDHVAELRVKLRREQDGLAPRLPAPTLTQALEKWVRAVVGSLTEKHINDRIYTLQRHLSPVLDLPLNQLDTARMDELRVAYLSGKWKSPNWNRNIREKPHSPGGWNRIRRHLVALINWCIDRELLREMPFRGKPLKIQERMPLIVWPEDVSTFLTIVEGLTCSQDVRTAIRLQVQLGLRENEALSARWEDFIERLGVYRPDKTKNRKSREIALPSGLLEYLRKNHGGATHGLLMPSKIGSERPHEAGYTSEAVMWAGKLLDIQGLHPHSLRATFATAHWEAGTPLSQIMSMLGHRDSKTTMIYINHRPKDSVDAQNSVAKVMGL
jgi:integrase